MKAPERDRPADILLVENEDGIRTLTRRIPEANGYLVQTGTWRVRAKSA